MSNFRTRGTEGEGLRSSRPIERSTCPSFVEYRIERAVQSRTLITNGMAIDRVSLRGIFNETA